MIYLSTILALALGAGAPPQAPRPGAAPHARADDALQDLLDEYEDAVDAWQEERAAAEDSKARRALKDKHPVKTFYARFEELAAAGSGQALLWTAEHVGDAVSKASARKAEKARQFDLLVSRHANAEWAGSIVALLLKQKRWLGEDGIRSRLRALGSSANTEAAASALASLASRLCKGRPSAEDLAESEALMDRILRDMPDTDGARRVREERDARRYAVGEPAPDFTTVDTDGVEFKLSDYRGKVVVLDFWGFW